MCICAFSDTLIFYSGAMRVPRVSGRVQTHNPVKTAKNAASEMPPPSPNRSAMIVIMSGVKNCTLRARLNAAPMAVLRIFVGNISENIGPYPEKFPVPIPTIKENINVSHGHTAMRFQNQVIPRRLTAHTKE